MNDPACVPLPVLTDADVVALGEGRLVVLDDLLSLAACATVRSACEHLDAAGALTPAGLGRAGVVRPAWRGDRTTWLGDHVDDPRLAELWQLFERTRCAVNGAAWLGLQRFGVQVACYPGDGARYVRHRDTFRGDPARRLTAILYLNEGWRPDHGGLLRAWEPDGGRDVAPRAGRMVLFLADGVEHEVLPTFATRWAATAWYRGASDVPWLEDPDHVGPAVP